MTLAFGHHDLAGAHRAVRFTVLAALLWAVGSVSPLAQPAPLVYEGVVTHVVDGDTVWVRVTPSNETLKVRIEGIDAPEGCQAGGASSRAALTRHVKGQSVTLIANPGRSHDDYGRLLARLQLQGEDVGRWMVSAGHAWSYSYRKDPGPYVVEQSRALAGKRGLFSDPIAENPRDFRKRHGSCYPR